MGIAYLPDWVAGCDIKDGTLVHVVPQWSRESRAQTGINALRALRKPPARVSVLLDALRDHIGAPARWSLN
jgi:DNA-binding transcriptional LysR family regulator